MRLSVLQSDMTAVVSQRVNVTLRGLITSFKLLHTFAPLLRKHLIKHFLSEMHCKAKWERLQTRGYSLSLNSVFMTFKKAVRFLNIFRLNKSSSPFESVVLYSSLNVYASLQ